MSTLTNLLTEIEAAALIGIAPATLRRQRTQGGVFGEIPSLKLGHRTVRYERAAIDAWIQEKARESYSKQSS